MLLALRLAREALLTSDKVEKKQTLTKLLENLNNQLDMSEGDELTLFYQKIVRDWKGYDKAMTEANDPKKQLRHTKQIQANIIQWERLYLRKVTPDPKEVQMKTQVEGLKKLLETLKNIILNIFLLLEQANEKLIYLFIGMLFVILQIDLMFA